MKNDILIVNKKTFQGLSYEYIGRPSILSNPYTHLELHKTKAKYKVNSRDEAIDKYREYLIYEIQNNNTEIINELYRLVEIVKNRTLILSCYCFPKRCHGEVIKEMIELILDLEKEENQLNENV